MKYVLHKSYIDYTFCTYHQFFIGNEKDTIIKQQEYSRLFKNILKSLVCTQVRESIQLYSKLIETDSQSKMSEDVLAMLSVFNLTYQEELAKLTGGTISEKQDQATISAYLFCFDESYSKYHHFNEYLNYFQTANDESAIHYVIHEIVTPEIITNQFDVLIAPISIANLVPLFENNYPHYWNELSCLNSLNIEDKYTLSLCQNYTHTIKSYILQLQQQYGSDHPIFDRQFWEIDSNFSICTEKEWNSLDCDSPY